MSSNEAASTEPLLAAPMQGPFVWILRDIKSGKPHLDDECVWDSATEAKESASYDKYLEAVPLYVQPSAADQEKFAAIARHIDILLTENSEALTATVEYHVDAILAILRSSQKGLAA